MEFLLGMLTCSPKDVHCNGVACINAFCEDTRFVKEKNSYKCYWQCFLENRVIKVETANDTTIFVRSYRESFVGRSASKLKYSS